MNEADIVSAAQSVDWTAIFGILGTLGGFAIGAFTTYKIQERQLAHEDKTRFHDLRMEKYTEFTQAANKAVSFFMSDRYDSKSCFEFQNSYNTVRLVASEDVFNHAGEINECFGILQDDSIDKKSINEDVLLKYNHGMARFIQTARKELIK